MPIEIKDIPNIQTKTNLRARVIKQLQTGKAYKCVELAEIFDTTRNTIQVILSELKKKGIVKNKKTYWYLREFEEVK